MTSPDRPKRKSQGEGVFLLFREGRVRAKARKMPDLAFVPFIASTVCLLLEGEKRLHPWHQSRWEVSARADRIRRFFRKRLLCTKSSLLLSYIIQEYSNWPSPLDRPIAPPDRSARWRQGYGHVTPKSLKHLSGCKRGSKSPWIRPL